MNNNLERKSQQLHVLVILTPPLLLQLKRRLLAHLKLGLVFLHACEHPRTVMVAVFTGTFSLALKSAKSNPTLLTGIVRVINLTQSRFIAHEEGCYGPLFYHTEL